MKTMLISTSLLESTYKKKSGTTSSYYWSSGSQVLPNRISISSTPLTAVRKKGRMLQHHSVGQFVGRFTMSEESPLKIYKPYNIRTQIWLYDDYPQFIGYGTIGITNAEGVIADTGDLVVLYTEDTNWETIRIFIFKGMGVNPDTMDEAMRHAAHLVSDASR